MVWLLTFWWQGAALTVLVAMAVGLPRRVTAATRHLVWFGALLALAQLGWTAFPHRATGRLASALGPAAVEPVFYAPSVPALTMTIVLGLWFGVALVRLARLLPGLHAVDSLRDCCRPFPSDLEARLPLWLEAKTCGRRTQLMICNAISGPTMLGFHDPCIAIPSSLIAALTTDELDQIVLHEYAHVQRCDDWARLVQSLLQPALWIHPAAAFIGRRLNLEREIACDEWVVARTGLPKAYAGCLVRVAEVTRFKTVERTLVPALYGRRRDLIRRVDRLLATKGKTRFSVSRFAVIASACMLVAVTTQLRAIPLVGELVETTLPYVMAPAIGETRASVAGSTDTFAVAALSGTLGASDEPESLDARLTRGRIVRSQPRPMMFEPDESDQPVKGEEPEGIRELPSTLYSLQFHSTAQSPETVASAKNPSGWRRFGTFGAGIGDVAQKASVGMADAFTNAGVSLARKF